MRKAVWVMSAVAVAALVACAPAAPATQGTPDDEVVLRGMAARYSASFNAGDAAALARMMTEDFESLGPDGVHTRGRTAFQQMEEASLKDRQAAGLNLTLNATTGYVKWIDARHAVVGGTYSMTGLPPGAPDKGAWVVVARKEADGSWLTQNSLVSEFVAPPPPPADPKKGK